ncbi:hypothetical protein HMI54_015692 [Coelomomyces lativittatus]|nr:hypothetical protein HMI54_015692 [Coelomomyces lativittatus]KAJ1513361.1 hypothetical protein HMI55_005660 [Coelomomyces lativittatus]KAJ1514659.1 hypothetical protein HMI56_007694 [Coelomomyces lativittatus]
MDEQMDSFKREKKYCGRFTKKTCIIAWVVIFLLVLLITLLVIFLEVIPRKLKQSYSHQFQFDEVKLSEWFIYPNDDHHLEVTLEALVTYPKPFWGYEGKIHGWTFLTKNDQPVFNTQLIEEEDIPNNPLKKRIKSKMYIQIANHSGSTLSINQILNGFLPSTGIKSEHKLNKIRFDATFSRDGMEIYKDFKFDIEAERLQRAIVNEAFLHRVNDGLNVEQVHVRITEKGFSINISYNTTWLPMEFYLPKGIYPMYISTTPVMLLDLNNDIHIVRNSKSAEVMLNFQMLKDYQKAQSSFFLAILSSLGGNFNLKLGKRTTIPPSEWNTQKSLSTDEPGLQVPNFIQKIMVEKNKLAQTEIFPNTIFVEGNQVLMGLRLRVPEIFQLTLLHIHFGLETKFVLNQSELMKIRVSEVSVQSLENKLQEVQMELSVKFLQHEVSLQNLLELCHSLIEADEHLMKEFKDTQIFLPNPLENGLFQCPWCNEFFEQTPPEFSFITDNLDSLINTSSLLNQASTNFLHGLESSQIHSITLHEPSPLNPIMFSTMNFEIGYTLRVPTTFRFPSIKFDLYVLGQEFINVEIHGFEILAGDNLSFKIKLTLKGPHEKSNINPSCMDENNKRALLCIPQLSIGKDNDMLQIKPFLLKPMMFFEAGLMDALNFLTKSDTLIIQGKENLRSLIQTGVGFVINFATKNPIEIGEIKLMELKVENTIKILVHIEMSIFDIELDGFGGEFSILSEENQNFMGFSFHILRSVEQRESTEVWEIEVNADFKEFSDTMPLNDVKSTQETIQKIQKHDVIPKTRKMFSIENLVEKMHFLRVEEIRGNEFLSFFSSFISSHGHNYVPLGKLKSSLKFGLENKVEGEYKKLLTEMEKYLSLEIESIHVEYSSLTLNGEMTNGILVNLKMQLKIPLETEFTLSGLSIDLTLDNEITATFDILNVSKKKDSSLVQLNFLFRPLEKPKNMWRKLLDSVLGCVVAPVTVAFKNLKFKSNHDSTILLPYFFSDFSSSSIKKHVQDLLLVKCEMDVLKRTNDNSQMSKSLFSDTLEIKVLNFAFRMEDYENSYLGFSIGHLLIRNGITNVHNVKVLMSVVDENGSLKWASDLTGNFTKLIIGSPSSFPEFKEGNFIGSFSEIVIDLDALKEKNIYIPDMSMIHTITQARSRNFSIDVGDESQALKIGMNLSYKNEPSVILPNMNIDYSINPKQILNLKVDNQMAEVDGAQIFDSMQWTATLQNERHTFFDTLLKTVLETPVLNLFFTSIQLSNPKNSTFLFFNASQITFIVDRISLSTLSVAPGYWFLDFFKQFKDTEPTPNDAYSNITANSIGNKIIISTVLFPNQFLPLYMNISFLQFKVLMPSTDGKILKAWMVELNNFSLARTLKTEKIEIQDITEFDNDNILVFNDSLDYTRDDDYGYIIQDIKLASTIRLEDVEIKLLKNSQDFFIEDIVSSIMKQLTSSVTKTVKSFLPTNFTFENARLFNSETPNTLDVSMTLSPNTQESNSIYHEHSIRYSIDIDLKKNSMTSSLLERLHLNSLKFKYTPKTEKKAKIDAQIDFSNKNTLFEQLMDSIITLSSESMNGTIDAPTYDLNLTLNITDLNFFKDIIPEKFSISIPKENEENSFDIQSYFLGDAFSEILSLHFNASDPRYLQLHFRGNLKHNPHLRFNLPSIQLESTLWLKTFKSVEMGTVGLKDLELQDKLFKGSFYLKPSAELGTVLFHLLFQKYRAIDFNILFYQLEGLKFTLDDEVSVFTNFHLSIDSINAFKYISTPSVANNYLEKELISFDIPYFRFDVLMGGSQKRSLLLKEFTVDPEVQRLCLSFPEILRGNTLISLFNISLGASEEKNFNLPGLILNEAENKLLLDHFQNIYWHRERTSYFQNKIEKICQYYKEFEAI